MLHTLMESLAGLSVRDFSGDIRVAGNAGLYVYIGLRLLYFVQYSCCPNIFIFGICCTVGYKGRWYILYFYTLTDA